MKVAAHLLFFFVLKDGRCASEQGPSCDTSVSPRTTSSAESVRSSTECSANEYKCLPSHINNVWTVGGVGWKSLRSATFVVQWTY